MPEGRTSEEVFENGRNCFQLYLNMTPSNHTENSALHAKPKVYSIYIDDNFTPDMRLQIGESCQIIEKRFAGRFYEWFQGKGQDLFVAVVRAGNRFNSTYVCFEEAGLSKSDKEKHIKCIEACEFQYYTQNGLSKLLYNEQKGQVMCKTKAFEMVKNLTEQHDIGYFMLCQKFGGLPCTS